VPPPNVEPLTPMVPPCEKVPPDALPDVLKEPAALPLLPKLPPEPEPEVDVEPELPAMLLDSPPPPLAEPSLGVPSGVSPVAHAANSPTNNVEEASLTMFVCPAWFAQTAQTQKNKRPNPPSLYKLRSDCRKMGGGSVLVCAGVRRAR
jgi:hypothetical protein